MSIREGSILVTGGAGYIGSHTVDKLVDQGFHVVVLDNLCTGYRQAVPDACPFYQGDIADSALVDQILDRHEVTAVIHFASHIVVPESVTDPLKYYRNNVASTISLLENCRTSGVNHFVFSSSAAVYGIPEVLPVNESTPTVPINPYGTSKLFIEWVLRDFAVSVDEEFSYTALRYFNVAGASDSGRLGQSTPNATHLIKVASETACGLRDSLTIYGSDYDTEDGTCIRDYIHVDDLADAHVAALEYLDGGGESTILNCGYGHGFSVREVIDMVKRVSGVDFPVIDGGRRAGDPPALVADATRLRRVFQWSPRRDDLERICDSAFRWQKDGVHRWS